MALTAFKLQMGPFTFHIFLYRKSKRWTVKRNGKIQNHKKEPTIKVQDTLRYFSALMTQHTRRIEGKEPSKSSDFVRIPQSREMSKQARNEKRKGKGKKGSKRNTKRREIVKEIVCRTRHKEFLKNNWNASNRWGRKNEYHKNKKKN